MTGAIQADGSVLFTGKGLLKQQYLVSLAEDGHLEYSSVKVKNGQIVSVTPPNKYSRFALIDSSGAAPAAAAGSIAPATVANNASQSAAPLDEHADPAVWGDYARLVGRDWHGYYHVSVRWSEPGKEMVEVWKYGPMRPSVSGQTIRTVTLRPSDRPRRLRATIVGSTLEGEHVVKVGKAGQINFPRHSFEMVGPNTIKYWGHVVEGNYGALAHAASPNATEPQRAVWGVYLDVVDKSFMLETQQMKVLMSYGWLVPGEVLYELNHYLDEDYLFSQHIYVSPEDGRLIAQSSPAWNRTGYGQASADGAVNFATRGFFAMGQTWTLQRRGAEQVEFRSDSAIESARSGVLMPVASEQVGPMRVAARQRREERNRQQAIAKAERAESRAAFMGALVGGLQEFSDEMSMYRAAGGGSSSNAQIEAAMDRAIDKVRSHQQAAALQSAGSSAPTYSSGGRAGASAFVPGVYVMDGGSYSLDVALDGRDLVVTEPNKVSRYTPHSDGSWHFYNANTDTVYGMRVIDGSAIEAFKPHQPGNTPTRLNRVSGGPATVAQVRTVNSDMNEIAARYKQKSVEDPDNTQVWVACSLAAHKRAMSPGAEADFYGAQMAQMLKQIMVDSSATPCSDAIPAAVW